MIAGAVDVQRCGVSTHEFAHLIVDYLDHEFARLDGRENVLTQRLFLDFVYEGLGNLVVDVGFDKGATYFLEALRDVDFGDAPLAFENFEASFEVLGKFVKHCVLSLGGDGMGVILIETGDAARGV